MHSTLIYQLSRIIQSLEDTQNPGLKALRQLTPLPQPRTEKVQQVNQCNDPKRNKGKTGHCPCRTEVVEHDDSKMRKRRGQREGRNQEGCNRGSGHIWVCIWEKVEDQYTLRAPGRKEIRLPAM